jgi:hypothetical protein
MDSRVWPGTSSMLLTIVGDDQAKHLMDQLRVFTAASPEKDVLRAFQVDVEDSI